MLELGSAAARCSKVELIRMMSSINPLDILMLYISSQPLLVVFMIRVRAKAISSLILGYFFKIKEMKSLKMDRIGILFCGELMIWIYISENETLKHLKNNAVTAGVT